MFRIRYGRASLSLKWELPSNVSLHCSLLPEYLIVSSQAIVLALPRRMEVSGAKQLKGLEKKRRVSGITLKS